MEGEGVMDTRLYEANDMVKVGCHDCAGCFECCRDMGQSVLLDPYDVYRLTNGLQKSFEELMEEHIELHSEAGLILPNLRMRQTDLACSFLDGNGRCSIHALRPGICRLFPLGRNYTPEHMSYFLLEDACPAKNKTKMKISKWIDEPRQKDYHAFLLKWHNLTKKVRATVQSCVETGDAKRITMDFLRNYYLTPYEGDFFEEFEKRVDRSER